MEPFHCLDLFSGERAISKAHAAKNLRSCELDIAHDPRDETCHTFRYNQIYRAIKYMWVKLDISFFGRI